MENTNYDGNKIKFSLKKCIDPSVQGKCCNKNLNDLKNLGRQ